MSQSLFPLLGVIAGIGMLAVFLVMQVRRSEDGAGVWLLYVITRIYLGLGFSWRANGRCPFPDEGPAIIIANHRSPLDPMLVWNRSHKRTSGRCRNIRVIGFLTAREFCDKPGLVGWICKTMCSIPTERDGLDVAATRAAIRWLKKGKLLGVFPEGRINRGEGLLSGNAGVAWLALTAQVPVYPVFIHNAPQGKNMVAPFYTFQRIRVSYGEKIDLSLYYGQKKTDELLREVTDLLMRHLAEAGGLTADDIQPAPEQTAEASPRQVG